MAWLRYELSKLSQSQAVGPQTAPPSPLSANAARLFAVPGFSSSSSSASMHHLLSASCGRFPATANYNHKDNPNSTTSISASPRTSTSSSPPSASRLPLISNNES